MGLVARGLLIVAALALIKPGLATDVIGFAVLGTVAIPAWLARRSTATIAATAAAGGGERVP